MKDDLISRQAALNEFKANREKFCDNTPNSFSRLSYSDKCRVDEIDNAIAVLVNLPSAQTELENKIRAIGYTGREGRIYIGGRLFAVRELPQ